MTGPTGMSPAGGDPGYDLDLAIASMTSDQADSRALLGALVEQLRSTLGGRLEVETRGGGFLRRSGAQELAAVSIDLGGDVLRAELVRGSVTCSVCHESGGIRIRSSEVDMATWLRTLLSSLQSEAAHSEATRAALEAIVIGSRG